MIEPTRIYYYFLLGAAGSLTAGYIGAISLTDITHTGESAIFGAFLGGLIGLAVAGYDGVATHSLSRFLRFGGFGTLFGGVGGGVAFLWAQFLYSLTVGEKLSSTSPTIRVLVGLSCWLLVGGAIGLGAVIKKGTQVYKGVLGGFAGALLGGSIYEVARVNGNAPDVLSGTPALTLLLLGGAIGGSVALITTALQNAWFEVADGKLKGRIYDVTKHISAAAAGKTAGVIGSDGNSAWIYLPGDPTVMPRHAEIRYSHGVPMLTPLESIKKGATLAINGRNISTATPLSNGDRVQVGETVVVYHQKLR